MSIYWHVKSSCFSVYKCEQSCRHLPVILLVDKTPIEGLGLPSGIKVTSEKTSKKGFFEFFVSDSIEGVHIYKIDYKRSNFTKMSGGQIFLVLRQKNANIINYDRIMEAISAMVASAMTIN